MMDNIMETFAAFGMLSYGVVVVLLVASGLFVYLKLNPKRPLLEPKFRLKFSNLNSFMTERKPWTSEGKMKELDAIGQEIPKIFVIGPYKVGKTSLLEWLTRMGVSIQDQPGKVANTKGENVYLATITEPNGNKREVMIVDTEGMFQPVEGAHPSIIRDFIIEQALLTADHIIFVLDFIHEYELTLLRSILLMYANSSHKTRSLQVVHNLQTITKLDDLRKYRDAQILPIFQDERRSFIRAEGEMLNQSITDRTVHHLFLGHQSSLREHNKKQFESMVLPFRDLSNRIVFSEGFMEAFRNVMTKYYTLNTEAQLKIEEDKLVMSRAVNFRGTFSENWQPFFPQVAIGGRGQQERKVFDAAGNERKQTVTTRKVQIACPGLIQHVAGQAEEEEKRRAIEGQAGEEEDTPLVERNEQEQQKQQQQNHHVRPAPPQVSFIDDNTLKFYGTRVIPHQQDNIITEYIEFIRFPDVVLKSEIDSMNASMSTGLGDICTFIAFVN